MSNKESFEDWCAEMNREYLEGTQGTEGFQRWFSNLIENHTELNKVYKVYSMPPRARSSEEYKPCHFMVETIGEMLYTAVEWKGKTAGRSESRKMSNLRNIKNYWDDDRIPMDIPRNGCAAYWINILSALQKKYKIFSCLDDLNRSLMHFGNISDPIPRRGLYVRDIRNLCIAYAIFHGLSFETTSSLIEEAQQKLSEAQDRLLEQISGPNETITQQVFDAFEPLIIDTGKKIPAFLSEIEQDCAFFPKPTDLLHWSAFGNMFEGARNEVYSGSSREKESVLVYKEIKDNLDMRVESMPDYFLRDIRDVVDELNQNSTAIARSELCNYIKNLLDLEAVIERNADGKVNVPNVENALEYMRHMYILAIMKGIVENEVGQYDTVTSAEEAIKKINVKLIEAGSRDIQYYYKSNKDSNKDSNKNPDKDSDKNSKNEIIAKGDVFDWFVVEAMKREEDIGEEEDLVSGYDTVIDFMQSGGI